MTQDAAYTWPKIVTSTDNQSKGHRLFFWTSLPPNPAAVRGSIAGTAGSDLEGGAGVCPLCICYVKYWYMLTQRADHSSRGVLPSVCVRACVLKCTNYPLHLQWDRQKRIV